MKNNDVNIDKLGRQIYNYQSQNNGSDIIDDFYFSRIVNKKTLKLLSRHIEVKCSSFKEMIKYQRLIDISLCRYLKKINEQAETDDFVYSTSFAISYKFKKFISNTENIVLNTSISKKPYRISEVKTLGAYSNIKYCCWDSMDNDKIKLLFKDQYNDSLSSKEEYAFSQIVSLFSCESSRNPATYITAPMVLELAEKFFYSSSNQFSNTEKKEECSAFDLSQYDIIFLLKDKSLIIKDYFLEYFPMAIKQAVSGSRVISDRLNETKNSKLFHKYDYGRANINKEKELETKNNTLKLLWQKEFPNKKITNLIKDWYDIELTGIDTLEIDGSGHPIV